jgi:hypothetical protein
MDDLRISEGKVIHGEAKEKSKLMYAGAIKVAADSDREAFRFRLRVQVRIRV